MKTFIAFFCVLIVSRNGIAQRWKYMSKEDAKVAKWEDKMQAKADNGDVKAMYELAEHYMSDRSYHEEIFIPLLQKARAISKCDACEANILARRCEERKRSSYSGHTYLDWMLDSSGVCPEGSLRMGEYSAANNQYDSAIFYTRKAAFTGYARAMYELATYYEHLDIVSKSGSTGPNRSKYMFWYKEAGDKGYTDAKDRYEIITKAADSSYARGLKAYNAKDYGTALYWFQICAKGNNDASAYFFVGMLNHTGLAGKTDISDARRGYESAGRLGMAAGYYFAAVLWWSDGFGAPAMEDYQKAADMGYAGAAEAKMKVQQVLSTEAKERERQNASYYARQNAATLPPVSFDLDKQDKPAKKARSACSSCGGSGTIHVTVYGGLKGPGNSMSFGEYRSCTACGGSGN